MKEHDNNSIVSTETACNENEAKAEENANNTDSDVKAEINSENKVESTQNSDYIGDFGITTEGINYQKPKKKKSKVIIALLIAVAVVIAAVVGCVLLFGSSGGSSEFVERTLYAKDNSLFYLERKDNTPILITEDFFADENNTASDLYLMNAVSFAKNGNKVFYAKRINVESQSFSLYCRFLNKPDEEPLKIADDVTAFLADEKGNNVLYLDTYGSIYNHNMKERTKVVSDVDYFVISDDCTRILYLTDDGGLYIQTVGGEKEKIDSDVTSVKKAGGNFENTYYLKDKELYLKKADADKIKIASDILFIQMICDNGDVYYIKENEVKGTGTLMDYIIDHDGLEEKDAAIAENYYYPDYEARDAALSRIWSREVLRKTAIKTVDSLYRFSFNDETSDMVNDSFVESLCNSEEADALIFTSYDSVDIKKVDINDFIDAVDKAGRFSEILENGGTVYKSDYQKCSYFDEFSKMILGTMKSDAATYLVKDGKLIKIETDSESNNFIINSAADIVYYIDKYDSEKEIGELRIVKIKDGAVVTNELYESDVAVAEIVSGDDILYCKDFKDGNGDLYFNKNLIEYDVNNLYVADYGKAILFYTDYDKKSGTGTLNIYSNGEKEKIADDVSYVDYFDNGDVLYYRDFSYKSGKGDLYIKSKGKETRIDYDVQGVFKTSDKYIYNFILSNGYAD